jgi:hypothetical protein
MDNESSQSIIPDLVRQINTWKLYMNMQTFVNWVDFHKRQPEETTRFLDKSEIYHEAKNIDEIDVIDLKFVNIRILCSFLSECGVKYSYFMMIGRVYELKLFRYFNG